MDQSQLPVDFIEFIELLNSNKVRYLLLGGWAVGFYGFPRATKDIDFLVAVDEANLTNLLSALKGFGVPKMGKKIFKELGNVFRMGRTPILIDIINQASGIDFETCYKRKKTMNIEGIEITLISKNDLIKNKKASARPQDLADVSALEKGKKRRL